MTDRHSEKHMIGIFLRMLADIHVPVTSVSERNEDHDTAIYLGGRYDGMHIQIAASAYYVVIEVIPESSADSGLRFTKGNGNLLRELEDRTL